jgi:hypothetical protein
MDNWAKLTSSCFHTTAEGRNSALLLQPLAFHKGKKLQCFLFLLHGCKTTNLFYLNLHLRSGKLITHKHNDNFFQTFATVLISECSPHPQLKNIIAFENTAQSKIKIRAEYCPDKHLHFYLHTKV